MRQIEINADDLNEFKKSLLAKIGKDGLDRKEKRILDNVFQSVIWLSSVTMQGDWGGGLWIDIEDTLSEIVECFSRKKINREMKL